MNNAKRALQKTYDIHTTWHSFCDYMKKWYYELCLGTKKDFTRSKRKYKVFKSDKFDGYPAMCRIKKYAQNKGDIFITSCDDSYHMRSDIVLITHECEGDFMGTTMLLVPQCAKEMNQVFLYPEHVDALIEKLKIVQERSKKSKFAI